MRNVRKPPEEDELSYGARNNHADYDRRNIHEEDEKKTFFIDGLRPEIMTLVARFRENQYRQDRTFERLIWLPKDEGN